MPPKRPATTFTSDQPTDRAAAAAALAAGGKRTRFAPNNAETVLEAGEDDLELDLEQGAGGAAKKKNRVTTEGYDSDSSAESDTEDGFGGAGGGRAGRGGGSGGQAAEPEKDEEEDDDMFGGAGTAKDTGLNVKGKKKEKEFLEMGDIEGQEFSKRDDEDAEDNDDEEDDEVELEEDYLPEDDEANADEAPRGRRSKKGMGYKLSSFNMKEELAEGRFTADGTYTANSKDPLADHDVWLSGLSKRSIRAAREAKERMDARQREREAEEAKSEEQLTQLRDDCMIGLLTLVRPGETVARALTRLGKAKTRADERAESTTSTTSAASQGKGKAKAEAADGGDAMDLGEDGDSSAAPSSITITPSQRYSKKIDRLTHFASTLLSAHGELEIYDQTYEDIIKTLKSEGAVRRDWVPPTDPDIAVEEAEEIAHKKAQAEADAAAAEKGQSGGRSRVVIARPTAAPAAAAAQYYYKWKSPPPGQPAEQEYGPYDRATFEGWIAGGYFGGAEAERILVRADGQEQAWRAWKELR
ncbi:hypothetical protein JCM10908_004191 [Rhodotorula pacifica]|uniref:uncharacterized protein n=1 Tax=Rhodotorula pacifica TaxID=1495444 RepID=UPI00316FFCD9